MSHKLFLFLETQFIMVFGSKKSCMRARLGFIRYFLNCSFHISKHLSLKNNYFKKWHDGCQKSAKKVSHIIWMAPYWEKKYFTGRLFILPEK